MTTAHGPTGEAVIPSRRMFPPGTGIGYSQSKDGPPGIEQETDGIGDSSVQRVGDVL